MTGFRHDGPMRLVLIGSGGYGYAEIDLTRPSHIIGGNNSGKTTLVNALQFLFVDDADRMRFGDYRLADTRKHYFDGNPGLVIFECLSKTQRRMLVIVRGRGPTSNHEMERYIHQGEYVRSDFLDDDGTARSWDDVRKHLSGKILSRDSFRKVTPKEMRQALLGEGEGPTLGIVPLRPRVDYEVFRRVFVDVLRLNDLDATRLKLAIMEICRGDNQMADDIDMKAALGQTHQKVKLEQHQAAKAAALQPTIDALRSQLHEATRLEQGLRTEWAALTRAQEEWRTTVSRREEERRREASEIDTRRGAIVDELSIVTRRIAEDNTSIGTHQAEITRWEQLKDRIGDRDRENIPRRLKELQAEIAPLQRAVAGRPEDPSGIDRDIKRRKSDLGGLEREARSIGAETLVDWLVANVGPERAERMARVLSSDFLRLPMGDDVSINHPSGMAAVIRNAFDPDTSTMVTDWIEADLSDIDRRDMATRTREDIDRDMKTVRDQMADLEMRLGVAKNHDEARNRLKRLEDEQTELNTLLVEIQQMEAVAKTIPAHRQAVDQIRDGLRDLTDRVTRLENERMTLQDLLGALESQRQADQALTTGIREAMSNQQPQTVSDELHVKALRADEIVATANGYRRRHAAFTNVTADIRSLHHEVSVLFPNLSPDRDAMLEGLDTVEADIRHREQAAKDAVSALVIDLRKQMADMRSSAWAVEKVVSRINTTQLANTRISDLDGIRLRFKQQGPLMQMISDLVDQPEGSLFEDADARHRAVDAIAPFIDHDRWSVAELFTIGIDIERRGMTNKDQPFDKLGSNGTGIAIKIVIGLAILRHLLRGMSFRMPFYIDEANALDDDNLSSVIAYAHRNAFMPILASPASTNCKGVEVMYHPRVQDGLTWIIPEERIDIRQDRPQASQEAAE